MRRTIILGIGLFFICSCTHEQNEPCKNEKALISYQELEKSDMRLLSSINISANLDSIKTFTLLNNYIREICKGKYPEAKYDPCWDVLPFIYDLKNFSLKPSNNKTNNILIPCFGFSCIDKCVVDFRSLNYLDVQMVNNNLYNCKFNSNKSIIKNLSLNELSNIIDSLNTAIIEKFFTKSDLIKNYGKRDSLLQYYNMLSDPYLYRISMDTIFTFQKLEPLISTIIKSYLKSSNDFTKKYLNKSLQELTNSDLRLIYMNIGLHMQICQPYEAINYVAPVSLDSIASQ